MYLELEKCTLTNANRTPFALSNLGDVNILEEIIGNCLADNPKKEKIELGHLIAYALTASRKFYFTTATVNVAQTKLQPKRIVLDLVDYDGNIKNLWIFLSQEPFAETVEILEVPELPEGNIKEFYLGSDYGTGIKATSLKEFLEYIIAEVRQADYDEKDCFSLTVEDD